MVAREPTLRTSDRTAIGSSPAVGKRRHMNSQNLPRVTLTTNAQIAKGTNLTPLPTPLSRRSRMGAGSLFSTATHHRQIYRLISCPY